MPGIHSHFEASLTIQQLFSLVSTFPDVSGVWSPVLTLSNVLPVGLLWQPTVHILWRYQIYVTSLVFIVLPLWCMKMNI